jgi:hypothetical protein
MVTGDRFTFVFALVETGDNFTSIFVTLMQLTSVGDDASFYLSSN